jgi:hypothetical protein
MCKAPKAPPPPIERPVQYLRNPVLDSSTESAIGQLRRGRSSLRTDLPKRNDLLVTNGPGVAQTKKNIEDADRTARASDLLGRLTKNPSLLIGARSI